MDGMMHGMGVWMDRWTNGANMDWRINEQIVRALDIFINIAIDE